MREEYFGHRVCRKAHLAFLRYQGTEDTLMCAKRPAPFGPPGTCPGVICAHISPPRRKQAAQVSSLKCLVTTGDTHTFAQQNHSGDLWAGQQHGSRVLDNISQFDHACDRTKPPPFAFTSSITYNKPHLAFPVLQTQFINLQINSSASISITTCLRQLDYQQGKQVLYKILLIKDLMLAAQIVLMIYLSKNQKYTS